MVNAFYAEHTFSFSMVNAFYAEHTFSFFAMNDAASHFLLLA
jgi:hypothetical protein